MGSDVDPRQLQGAGRAPQPILWGGDAVRSTLGEGAPLGPEDEHSLGVMRAMVGPLADERSLRKHFASARGRVRWAVNGCLREVLLLKEPPPPGRGGGGGPGGLPRRGEEGGGAGGSGACDGEEEEEVGEGSLLLSMMSVQMLEAVLAHCSCAAIGSCAVTCRQMAEAALSEPLWHKAFVDRWGSSTAEGVARELAEGRGDAGTWRGAFRARHELQQAMRCPACTAGTLLPVVYGYPSPPLVQLLQAGRVRMGGDYLLDGDPYWMCKKSCGGEWAVFPYANWDALPPWAHDV